MIPGRVIA